MPAGKTIDFWTDQIQPIFKAVEELGGYIALSATEINLSSPSYLDIIKEHESDLVSQEIRYLKLHLYYPSIFSYELADNLLWESARTK